jgi:hypothetical protein
MEGRVTIANTPDMDAEAQRLANHAALIWLGGTRPKVSAADIVAAIEGHTGIDHNLFRVVPHYPEDFLVTFKFQHHREQVTALPGRFNYGSQAFGNLDIHATNWRLNAHADVKTLFYHVHLCIENVPLNAWTDYVASRLLGPDTVLHYFDIATLRKEDASVISLWAWSSIPKIQMLTLTDNPTAGSGGTMASTVTGRQGLERRALVHLDLLEDFSPDADGIVPRRPRTEPPYPWRLGVVCGEKHIREKERHKTPARRCNDEAGRHGRNGRDRRDDDDEDGRHGRQDRRTSWSQRLFRSRSRAPQERGGEYQRDNRETGAAMTVTEEMAGTDVMIDAGSTGCCATPDTWTLRASRGWHVVLLSQPLGGATVKLPLKADAVHRAPAHSPRDSVAARRLPPRALLLGWQPRRSSSTDVPHGL